jgi:hypothetical protein
VVRAPLPDGSTSVSVSVRGGSACVAGAIVVTAAEA